MSDALPSAPSAASPAREIARIAVPVSLEFVFTLVLSFVNQVIVGALGAVAIAAVGLANSLIFILLLTLGALGASASILVARARGGGRRAALDRTVSLAVLLGVVAASACALPLFVWAGRVLPLSGAAPEVAAAGSAYLRVIAAALVPGVLGAVLSGVLRSLGHARTPMTVTLFSVSLNSLLGYGLVFGVGPLPALGVVGAAWATLVAQSLKAAVLLWQVYGPRDLARWALPGPGARRAVLAPLFTLAVPLGITELAWSSGTFLYNVVFQRLGTGALAASQMVNTLEGVFIVGSIGLMSATTALVGRELGAGREREARAWAARILRAGVMTGLGFGLLFAASALLLGPLFPRVAPEVRQIAVWGILINAAAQVFKVRNMIYGAGLLPSGNDTRGVIVGDVVGAFVVGLPLALLLGLHTPLGVFGVFLARVCEEVAKMSIFAWRARRLPWTALAEQGRQTAAA